MQQRNKIATGLVSMPVSCNRQEPDGKKKAWRIFKICLLTFFSLILFLSGIVACLVNFVFTPEKVTPVVERIASDYLDAEVKIGSVELTFFSTYPRVALDVKDGLVVSHALKDSCFDKTDTLIGFKDCRIKANLGAYLARKRVVVRNITIDSARMYLFTDKNGVSNYDIFKKSNAGEGDSFLMADSVAGADSAALIADSVLSDTENTANADSVASPLLRGIHVRSLILNDAYVYFDDRSNRVYGRVEGADLRARLSLSKPVSRLKLDFSNDNVLYYGNIAKDKASGKATLNIPSGLATGSYKLKVFSEQCNGDKMTDYASAFQDISLTVTEYVAPSTGGGTVISKPTTSRISGYDRFETAVKVADQLKKELGVTKFNSIVVAYSDEFADALSASAFAQENEAPVLVVNENNEEYVKKYIEQNLVKDGKVYIMGGTAVVTERFENNLSEFNTVRLGGSDRYETNLLALKQLNLSGKDTIIIASGLDYADALSASSTGLPIMIAGDKLTKMWL